MGQAASLASGQAGASGGFDVAGSSFDSMNLCQWYTATELEPPSQPSGALASNRALVDSI
jgi:hypothetical protein